MFGKVSAFLIFFQIAVTSADVNCDCGQHYENDKDRTKYPMMALIFYDNCGDVICAATIIDELHLITAANCFKTQLANSHSVAVGPFDVGKSPFSLNKYKIKKVTPHQHYITFPDEKEKHMDHDIAIVTVRDKILFHRDAKPACLPLFNDKKLSDLKITKVLAIGWDLKHPETARQEEFELNIVDTEACGQSNDVAISERNMCTQGVSKDKTRLLRGGSLHYLDPKSGKFILVGLTGWGPAYRYDNNLHLDTDISPLLDFISNTTGVNYCKLH